jgi:hypothetical protein
MGNCIKVLAQVGVQYLQVALYSLLFNVKLY